jgi:hypothetical protein
MIIKTIIGAFFSIAGILSSFLGVMFLIASGEKSSRLTSGIILVACGVPVLIAGARLFVKGIGMGPAAVRKRLIRLAKMNHGELTEDAIEAEFGGSDTARFQLGDLLKSGIASESGGGGRRVYIFPEFQLELIMKKCPYCGGDYPVSETVERCPNCGGDLKMQKSRLAGKEGSYSMDEGDDSGLG